MAKTKVLTLGEAILADVIANPHDIAPRMAYADWCADNGDPERAPAAVGVRITSDQFWRWFGVAFLPAFRGKPPVNLTDDGQGWIASKNYKYEWYGQERRTVAGRIWGISVRAGFPEGLRMPLTDWSRYGRSLLKRLPLVVVKVGDGNCEACLAKAWGK